MHHVNDSWLEKWFKWLEPYRHTINICLQYAYRHTISDVLFKTDIYISNKSSLYWKRAMNSNHFIKSYSILKSRYASFFSLSY